MTTPIGSFSGLVSNLDTRALIDAIIAQARVPVDRLQVQKTRAANRKAALALLRGKVAAFEAAAARIRNAANLASGATGGGTGPNTVSITPPSGGSAGFTASLTGAGVPGAYGIEVLGLAQAPRLRSNSYVDPNAALGYTGNMAINGVATNIVAGDSLTSIAGKLNTSIGAFATASVENIGPGQFQLVVTGNTVGLGNTFTVTSTGQGPGVRLGFQSTVYTQARVVESNHAYRNNVGALATATTRITDLRTNGNVPLGYTVGDTITVQLVDKDGTLRSDSLVVGVTTTLQDVLSLMSGQIGGTTNSVVGGRLRLTSTTLGPSSMAISSLFVENAPDPSGRVQNAGTAVSNTAPALLDQVGQNASVRINGTTYSAAGNTGITFAALPDLTLNLLGTSIGGSTTLTVNDGTVPPTTTSATEAASNVKSFIDAYNELRTFINEQSRLTVDGNQITNRPDLYGESILRTIKSALVAPIFATNQLADPTLNRVSQIGISLTRDGTLSFDQATFDSVLASNGDGVRLLLAETLSSSVPELEMVSTGGLAPTGTFDVDISQAATRAGMLGAVFGGVYTSVSGSDQIAIRDISTGYLATATITPGMTLADIVSAINTSASNPVSEVRQGREYLVGAVAATGVSTLDLLNVGGSPLGITDGDSLRISGTRGDGSSYSTTFLVTDAATQTLEQLRSAAQAAIGSSATVGITDGRLTVTTLTGGASTTLQITSDNLGGGTFGQDDGVVVTIGRPPVPVFAQITGGALELVQLNYGASQGLRVEFTDEAGDGFEQLGFTANQTAMGLDVVGTIGGFSATGFGQTLTGDAGTGVAGLVMRYTGNTTGLIGSVGVSVGLGALLERATETMLLSNVGTLDVTSAGYDARMASLDGRIAFLEAGLERREANLVRRFARLEESLLRLQQAGLALGSFIDAQNQANSR